MCYLQFINNMISTIIPVYKKTDTFLKNLKINYQYLKETEIIIVNDDPEASIKNLLQDYKLKLIENTKNLGFGGAVNKGVRSSSNNYVFLINSDVELKNDQFKNSIKLFDKEKKLFAVGFAQTERDSQIVGKNSIYWKNGFFRHKKAPNILFGKTAWAEGGSSIFSKEKFLELGGFDQLYSPFYWEDIDISYRAWKKGYKVLFNPNILVSHYHESTISTYFSSKTIKKISYRNQLIFIWKNITDIKLIISHYLLLIPNTIILLLKGEFEFISGFFSALSKIYKIYKQRKNQIKSYLLTDQEVFNSINEK